MFPYLIYIYKTVFFSLNFLNEFSPCALANYFGRSIDGTWRL